MSHVDRRHSQTQDRYAADDLETMQEATRYTAHVFNLFRPHIGARVLEVGCGIATMSRLLAEISEEVVAIEPNENCAVLARQAMRDAPNFSLRHELLEHTDPQELASHRFDTVFCVNVLEHIEDDVEALRTFREAIVPGGHVLIFVPAVQAAFGPLDSALGHYRRYSKKQLSKAFVDADLEVLSMRYTNPIGLIGWWVNARILKSASHSRRQVRLFDRWVAPWALRLERLIPMPIGLSLTAVARRR